MRPPWIAKPIGHNLEPLGSADPMLDRDPEAAEAAVVFLLLRGQFSTFWFLVGDVEIGVFFVITLIATVGLSARRFRQGWPGATDRQIMAAPGI